MISGAGLLGRRLDRRRSQPRMYTRGSQQHKAPRSFRRGLVCRFCKGDGQSYRSRRGVVLLASRLRKAGFMVWSISVGGLPSIQLVVKLDACSPASSKPNPRSSPSPPSPLGLRLVIDRAAFHTQGQPIALGDSICVSGVCLTVAAADAATLAFDVIAETLARTTLGDLAARLLSSTSNRHAHRIDAYGRPLRPRPRRCRGRRRAYRQERAGMPHRDPTDRGSSRLGGSHRRDHSQGFDHR